MLIFVPGTYSSPKKEYINNRISDAIDAGKKTVLIVPEQSAYERETEYLFSAGAVRSNKLTVTGFSRIIHTLLGSEGLAFKPQADESARAVIMSLAVEEVADRLNIYKSHSARPRLVSQLLAEYQEFRHAGLSTLALSDALSSVKGSAQEKLGELALIFTAYEALLSQRFSDSTDNIPATAEFLKTNRFFEGWEVFVDDFRGITGAQLALLQQIILQADKIYVSVCANGVSEDETTDAFAHSEKLVKQLKAFAHKNSVEVRVCREDLTEKNPVFNALHEGLYAVNPDEYVYNGGAACVTLSPCADKYEEASLVALQIRNLIENEDIRCRDIAIIERDGSYEMPLASALTRYGLPVFRDRSDSLADFPPVRMLTSALKIAARGFETQSVLSYMKSGMTGLSPEEISVLETYAFIWQIDTKQWEDDFTFNPKGFDGRFDEESAALLERINESRRRVITPLIGLRKKLREKDAEKSCLAIWNFLGEMDVRERFCDYAQGLHDSGDEAGALACSGVWDCITSTLDAVHDAIGSRSVSAERLGEIFDIMISSGKVEKVPAGTDEIVIGTADRIRFASPRVIFIVGANNGIFPAQISNGGLFTVREKRALSEGGIVLDSTPENAFDEERLITYCAVNACSERLFVSYSLRSLSGDTLEPSEIVSQIKALLPNCAKDSPEAYSPEEKVGSPATAFTQYTLNYRNNNAVTSSLREYCMSSDTTKKILPALEKTADKTPAKIEDGETATALFGRDMKASASKAEQYFSCAFNYFCKYGIKISKPEIAQIDNRIRGTIIHKVMEDMFNVHPRDEFVNMSRTQLIAECDRLCDNYIDNELGGREDKTATVQRAFDNIKVILHEMVPRIQREYKDSRFVYSDMELGIGFDKNMIKPYRIDLSDGGSLNITGEIDRVDTYTNENGTYVRIADYKSGFKKFSENDIPNGRNLQMPMYLFCLVNDENSKYYGNIPAGFVYVPAKADDAASGSTLGRNAGEDETEIKRRENSRLFGCVLDDDDVIDAMGRDWLDVDKKTKAPKFILSEKQFEGLETVLCEKMKEMGESLHAGKIEALPAQHGQKLPCAYCDYYDICLREQNDPEKAVLKVDKSEFLTLLSEKAEEEEDR